MLPLSVTTDMARLYLGDWNPDRNLAVASGAFFLQPEAWLLTQVPVSPMGPGLHITEF